MKAITTLLVLTIASTARADDADQVAANLEEHIRQAWYQDSETSAWLLADAAADGFNPSPCVKMLGQLPAERRTDKLRDACDAIEYASKIKEVERWITMAAESDSINNRMSFEHCVAIYKQAIDAGVRPAERVPQRRIRIGHDLVMWSGTITELKAKYCDPGFAKIKAELARREAPFRKVLRNDKLAMALGFNATASYVLPGGDASMNPAKLAASKVWFDSTSAPSNETQNCADGRRRTLVRRYVFDANHKLVKTTTKEVCGAAIYK